VRSRCPGGATFRVLRRNLPELNERIERLARRAERLGTAPLALREIGEDVGEHAVVVLEGEPPALAGWTLAAVVDHRDEEPRVRIASSAAPAPDPQRFREPRCDHCRLRRRRVETYVVWHAATQRLRQVGTGCLRDFLGGHDPERLCRQAEYVLLARESIAAAAGRPHVPTIAADGTDVSLGQAARSIGVSVDTLRRWDRAGKLETFRNENNQRRVPRQEVERLTRRPARHEAGDGLSARNRFPGIVTSVEVDGVMALVEIEAGPHRITAAITRDAVQELGLVEGARATATVKATSVMIENSDR
jgi:molybdopterin-binding protein